MPDCTMAGADRRQRAQGVTRRHREAEGVPEPVGTCRAARRFDLMQPCQADLDAARCALTERWARVQIHVAILETLRLGNHATRGVEGRLAFEIKVLELMQSRVDAIADELFSADSL